MFFRTMGSTTSTKIVRWVFVSPFKGVKGFQKTHRGGERSLYYVLLEGELEKRGGAPPGRMRYTFTEAEGQELLRLSRTKEESMGITLRRCDKDRGY